ncbi:hypothetical protein [Crocinitomix algicola]|uniref:hypothetical protein n=1 Tax=Crocinitomix algicola TaxID=1740263 RepID=UPI000830ED1E|nr:hypothetical protein [Crocinitomix algicola]
MPNILKYLSLSALLFLISSSYAQKLINANFDLNPGGVVRDIAYDKFNDVYYFVGDFTSFNGVECPNFAVVNGNDFSVNTSYLFNVIDEIDGAINSIEVYQDSVWGWDIGWSYRFYIFIGGEFTTVNGSEKNGIFKLNHVNFSESVLTAPYLLNEWNPLLESVQHVVPIVYDILLKGDTLVVGGDFQFPDPFRMGLIAYNAHNQFLNDNYPRESVELISMSFPQASQLELYNSDLFVTSYHEDMKGRIGKFKSDGYFDHDFSIVYGGAQNYFNCIGFDDSLLVYLFSLPGGGGVSTIGNYMAVADINTGEDLPEHSLYRPPGPTGTGEGETAYQLAMYKDYVFSMLTRMAPINNIYSVKKRPYGVPILGSNWESNSSFSLNTDWREHLFVTNNILFASFDNLTEAEGESRIGLMAYCLEPMDLKEFTEFDTLVCQNELVTFTVEQAEFADGYIWEYTGSGIDIGNTGLVENTIDTLSNFTGNAWSTEIRITPTFTPGELIVTPFATCGEFGIEKEDMLLGKSISISIASNPLPNAVAGDDFALTCSITEATLHGHSDTLGVTYSWMPVGGIPELDMHAGQDTTITAADTYVLSVTNEIGCMNFDSITVFMDTIRPNFDPIEGPFDLTCADSTRTYTGFCNNLIDTTSFWVALATNDTMTNPLEVDLPGQYNFYTINNENECIDSLPSPILVYLNQPSPNIEVLGYTGADIGYPIDTLNCYDWSFTLTAYSDTLETILNWVNADSTEPIGDIINITESGNYYVLAENTENGCKNFKGYNIAADFSKPNVILPDVNNLNCSYDSLKLEGGTIFLDTLLSWTGGEFVDAPNPIVVNEPGWYFLTVTKNENGCSETDSMEVIATNFIDVSLGDDAVLCDGDLLYLTANYVGEISGISYLWNDGSTDGSTFFTAGVDEFAIVEVFGDDGCYGTDTLAINIPPVPEIKIETFRPCSGENGGGSIVITPESGFFPFEYSIDNGESFQVEPTFSELAFGTYHIWVKDSLNCFYEFDAVIDEKSKLPEPLFVFSTYNFEMDTVIVIDISNPPTDSVQWVFSEELEWVGDSDGSPLIKLPETGSFFITMNGYYGDCLVSSTKEIFVSEFDSTFANLNNQNGIKSLELYPNPTTGNFTANINFHKKQRVQIAIQDMTGYIYETRTYLEVDEIEDDFEMDGAAINGTYVLRIVAEFDAAYITFVLSR